MFKWEVTEGIANYFNWENRHYIYHTLHKYTAKAIYNNGKNSFYL
jgi:hypothetical protein